jgi:hypothetical protein
MTDYTVWECQNTLCGDKCLLRCRTAYKPKNTLSSEDCPVFKYLYIPDWKELYTEDI